ncbi:uncharacterized protein Z518_05227 [Rhinocladiella mackenziei CBS 650.93]|uniref:TLC domain-containing protein n=1 Tax=Rhinocladiella mackenziei CBS 650.93 TaxID=1442369 RepID=A0A0D2IEX1_9EURO|nr:uncharacterized protein Z518_05227 [Rhinocladiella mackenziei CBS 650.93]KIX04359.1 hypothetical protein Z518_05227 [Rhinocladiella mackenziei CBS 650.93]
MRDEFQLQLGDLFKSRTVLVTVIILLCFLANQPPFNQAGSAVILSYAQEKSSTQYVKGPRDVVFVVFHAMLFLSLRYLLVDQIYPQVARYLKAKPSARFSEQLFQLTYFFFSSSYGIYVSVEQSIWRLSINQLLDRLQDSTLDGKVKYLYLIETAWWVHEAAYLAMGLEKRRKDFYELIIHHVVTITLILGSYWYNYTDFGLMILVPHGASDALLSCTPNPDSCPLHGSYFYWSGSMGDII